MKWISYFLAFLSAVSALAQNTQSRPQSLMPEYVNFYGISWRGSAHDNLAYARQMSYKYVFYQKGMELDPLSDGMYFYIETPEYSVYRRGIISKKTYSKDEINFYESHCVLKDSVAAFPANLASGWIAQPGSGDFTVLLDFQQQAVISWAIDSILDYTKAIQLVNPRFKFAGFAWDEPTPAGDFWDIENGKRIHAKLEKWNNGDHSARLSSSAREKQFQSYTDGHLEYYKQLFSATRKLYPHSHFISEPYSIYDSWIKLIKDRKDAKDFSPDILCQEGSTTMFVDDKRIAASGLITKQNILCTTPDKFGEAVNLLLAAKAAVNGSGFTWYGRFGGTGDMPDYKNITEVPARLKLIRVIPAWENKNGSSLISRVWDGQTYKSSNAFASADIIYAKKPGTQQIFAVFLTSNGTIHIPSNKKVVSIFAANDLFSAEADAMNDFQIHGQTVKTKTDKSLNKGFILTIR
ncbi:hypothetical protein [Dyadobacter pollutisoli]|uniref:Glycoside hydrolase family 42 N-terminal domain-containing protein n=1 Tax=Dyadobacter pollutisoli TaxID=2910158 RepID=A0A9E8NAY5_9BACT|nr:hypothetical protein [Dyadobacter pollutisoli]WAC13220.1 hypothetical protein ON006_04490 [Dyadobacter pollutisoli]